MPTYSMEELMRQQFGDGNVTLPLRQNQTVGGNAMVGRRVKRSVVETKELIKSFILKQGRPCLILEICDHLERKATPHLRGILSEMVRAGELVQDQDIAAGAVMPRFWYSLP